MCDLGRLTQQKQGGMKCVCRKEMEMRNKRQKLNWANLPTDVVRSIASFLQEDDNDVNNFRYTCKKWRQATAISTILPLIINPSSCKKLKLYYSAVSLLRRGPSHGNVPASPPWMISVVEPTKGNIQSSHPFSISSNKRKRDVQVQHPDDPTRFLMSRCFGGDSFVSKQFQSTILDAAYHLVYVDDEEKQLSSAFDKVMLVSNRRIPSMHDCGLLALHDGGELGGYMSFKNQDDEEELKWFEIVDYLKSIIKFDDILLYKGKYLALDRQGKVYTIYIDENNLEINTLVNCPIPLEGRKRSRGRRLVTSSTGTLYLIDRVTQDLLKVYKLVKVNKSESKWERVYTLEDEVLFITRVYCFFVSASEFSTCDLKNSIVFTNNAFPKYVGTTWEQADAAKNGSQIFVFQFGIDNGCGCVPISRFPDFPLSLWSCPSWASDAMLSSTQFQRETEEEEDDREDVKQEEEEDGETTASASRKRVKMHSSVTPTLLEFAHPTPNISTSSAVRGDTLRIERPSSSSPILQLAEQNIEMNTTYAAQENITRVEMPSEYYSFISEIDEVAERIMNQMNSLSKIRERATITPATNEQGCAAEEVSHHETLREENEITHSVPRANISSITQGNRTDNSSTKFEGLDIRSDLLQTLQNISSKHGNLLENITIRSSDMVSKALESLATAVLILKETSARSLSDSQANYLDSVLSDLQCMHFKVDWLAPFVEKAVQLHRSKPLMDSRDQLLRRQAKVIERQSKLIKKLAEVYKLEKEMEEEVANASKLIPFSGNVDLDKPVGLELP